MPKSNKEIIAKLREWLKSPEGKAKLLEFAEECKQMRAELEQQSQVSWEDLNKPVDF